MDSWSSCEALRMQQRGGEVTKRQDDTRSETSQPAAKWSAFHPVAPSPSHPVHVRDLVRRFGSFTAVDHVSFEVRRGEVFGCSARTGPARRRRSACSAGCCRPRAERCEWPAWTCASAGLGPTADRIRRAEVLALRPAFGAGRTWISSPAPTACAAAGRRDRIDWALREFELAPLARLPSGQLPGGYKQRLAMAAALLHEPEILFLDEPTSGADPLARREFWRRITALAEQGVTVIVTTHFMEEAEYCDRVAILDAGRVLAQGTPAEVRRRARSEQGRTPTMEDAFIAIVEEAREWQNLISGRLAKLRRIWSLVRKEARQIVRDPSSIAIGVVLPVILILLFGYGLSLDVKDVPRGRRPGRPFARGDGAGGRVPALARISTPQLLTSMPQARELMLAAQGGRHRPHPPGLRPAAQPRATPKCRSSSTGPTPTVPGSSRAMPRGRSANGRRAAPPKGKDVSGGPVAVQERLWFNEANDSRYFLVPGLIVLIMTLIGALLTALVMAREWERGTLEALFVTPVRAGEILLGKTIPYFVLGMVGLALCVLAAKFLFHVPLRGSVCVLAGVSMLYLLVALGIGLLISSATQEPVRGQPGDDAGHVHAGDDALGVPLRPAQHAGRGSADHLRPAGPLLRRPAADDLPGRGRLERRFCPMRPCWPAWRRCCCLWTPADDARRGLA